MSRYEMKTKPSDMDPMLVISQAASEKKREEGAMLLDLFQRATGQKPVVWGGKMIGFGTYRYQYASGHRGEAFAAGFAVTKSRLTLYLYLESPVMQGYLARLGKVTSGKSCVYVNRLTNIDLNVLEEMIRVSLQHADEW